MTNKQKDNQKSYEIRFVKRDFSFFDDEVEKRIVFEIPDSLPISMTVPPSAIQVAQAILSDRPEFVGFALFEEGNISPVFINISYVEQNFGALLSKYYEQFKNMQK